MSSDLPETLHSRHLRARATLLRADADRIRSVLEREAALGIATQPEHRLGLARRLDELALGLEIRAEREVLQQAVFSTTLDRLAGWWRRCRQALRLGT